MITHSCDRCAARVSQNKGEKESLPKGWIRLQPMRYQGPHYEICPKCIEQLGLKDADTATREKSLADRTLSILEEIAENATEDCDRCIS